MEQKKKSGYASYKRFELEQKLKPQLGAITNISTDIVANLSKKSVGKMSSEKSIEKS